MLSKSLHIILISAVFCVSERSNMCITRISSRQGFYLENKRIYDLLPDDYYTKNELVVYKDCGSVLTSAPGTIQLFNLETFKQRECTWELHAPQKHHVYIERFKFFYSASIGTQERNNITIEMFDGDKSSQKLLYKFGNRNLDKAISSGRELIIKLKPQQDNKFFSSQDIEILYHFINLSDYLKLKQN